MNLLMLLAVDAALLVILLAAVTVLIFVGRMFESVATRIVGPESQMPRTFNLLFVGAWSSQAVAVVIGGIGVNHGWWS